jgi:FtsP/CotA-like multicopper oxidase with cupredoxin domain
LRGRDFAMQSIYLARPSTTCAAVSSVMITRREILRFSGALAAAGPLGALAQDLSAPDYRLEIAPATLEFAPGRSLRTLAYNGQIPGSLLRMKEGRPVTVEVTNHSDRPEVVHWHGQFLPPAIDGASEEGTPLIAPGASARYAFTPGPAGFRWYHTHTMAMNDLTRAQYGGQHGPLWIEPRDTPGRYDREFFLVLHDWAGRLTGSDDGAMNPVYAVSTINGKALGAGEPLRVRTGEHVLLHILNSSPTEVHWVALSGHSLQVLALDGNPVPEPRSVPMLRLAPAERVCAMVVMDNPGVWIFGEVRRHVQAAGMGVVVEYADQGSAARWQQPVQHAGIDAGDGGVQVMPLVFESKFRGHGAMEAWTINGRSWPESAAPPLVAGRRYRLQFINRSNDDHPVHLHRHSFELRVLGASLAGEGGTSVPRGILKDVVLVDAQTRAEVEFTADNPGDTLFHCHQQDHMDLGFMMLFKYA